MNLFQPLVGYVGIDLSGGDRGVAKHGLDTPDVGAIDEEVCGKAMA